MIVCALLLAAAQPRLIAVLELQSKLKAAEREAVDRAFFADRVRHAALAALPGANVMTRENMEVLARAHGKDLAACEGECEVDTGRTLGADYVVSGDISRVGSQLAISLRLHDTAEGRLLAVEQALGKDADALLRDTDRAVAALFKPLTPAAPPPAPRPQPPSEPLAVSSTRAGPVQFALSSGTAHPGDDLNCRTLTEPSAELCRHECANDLRCLAFVYVPPGLYQRNPNAPPTCCLKSRATAGVKGNAGLVYGERKTAPPRVQIAFERMPRTNLQGDDYRHFGAESPEACERACGYDLRCAAFTFVKRGRNVCWLKSVVPARSHRAPQCESGRRL
jgi:hypothetical protein